MPIERNRRTVTLLVVPLVVLTAAGTTATALTPALLAHHPLLLIVLNARNRNLVATASLVHAPVFFAVALVRRFLEDPFLFFLGRLYGDGAVRWIEKRTGGVAVRFVERGFRKASYPFVFFFPGGLVCVLAGATGMAWRTFVALDVLGTLTVITMLRLVGGTIASPVETVRRFLAHNIAWTTAISAAFTIVWLVASRQRGVPEIVSVTEVVEELEREADPHDGGGEAPGSGQSGVTEPGAGRG